MTMFYTIKRARAYVKNFGFLAFLKLLIYKVLCKKSTSYEMIPLPKRDVVEFYKFLTYDDFFALDQKGAQPKTVNWVIPSFSLGSGGHLNIFRFISYLEKAGYRCNIIIDGYTEYSSPDKVKIDIREHFVAIDADVYIGKHNMPAAEVTFATSWTTAYTVKAFQSTNVKMYFVQDFEPLFYAQSSEYVLAENTYKFGFKAITAGSWLSKKLSSGYGMQTYPVGFSYDHDLYYTRDKKQSNTKRVFFYSRPPTPRRAFELGVLVMDYIYRNTNINTEFVLAGWDVSEYELPFPHLNAGVVSISELPDLYSQVDVALVLSLTNLSLLPLELMACGCPVVSNKGENVEWLLNSENAALSDLTVQSLGDTVIKLLEDDVYCSKLSLKGKAFAHSTSWINEADRFLSALAQARGA